jgi:MFS family permease
MIALGNLLIGLGFASLLLVASVPGFVVFILIWTLGEMIESPLASAVAADRAPEHARGRYQSAYGSMFGLAWMLGPVLGTSIYQVSPDALWVACGLVGVASAGLALAAGRRPAPVPDRVDAPST